MAVGMLEVSFSMLFSDNQELLVRVLHPKFDQLSPHLVRVASLNVIRAAPKKFCTTRKLNSSSR